jgi:hypothetical protein
LPVYSCWSRDTGVPNCAGDHELASWDGAERRQNVSGNATKHWYCTKVPTNEKSKGEKYMCPVCIASTAVMVAGAGSTGGILAVCIGRLRKFLHSNRLGLLQKTKEK